jgi:hypothetical protein
MQVQILPLLIQNMNEISKWIFFDLLSIYFVIIRQISKFHKMDWK